MVYEKYHTAGANNYPPTPITFLIVRPKGPSPRTVQQSEVTQWPDQEPNLDIPA